MSVWRRYLVKDVSGRLVDLPSRLLDRADDGTAPLPAYAGRCVEMVAAVLVGGRGAPPRVAEMEFTKLYFDQSGFVDAAKRERMMRLMLESCADRRGRHAGPPAGGGRGGGGRSDGDRTDGDRTDGARLARRAGAARDQLTREFGWDPKPAELNAVLSRLDPARLDGASPAGGRTLH